MNTFRNKWNNSEERSCWGLWGMGHLSLLQGPSHDKGLLTVVFWWPCGPWWHELSSDIGQTNRLLYYVAIKQAGSSWKWQWGFEASLSVFGLKEIERKCEFPNVVHTIPDQRWYTPFHITGGTHHTRTQGTQTHRQRNWHTHNETSTYLQTHTCDMCKNTHTCALRSTHHMIWITPPLGCLLLTSDISVLYRSCYSHRHSYQKLSHMRIQASFCDFLIVSYLKFSLN